MNGTSKLPGEIRILPVTARSPMTLLSFQPLLMYFKRMCVFYKEAVRGGGGGGRQQVQTRASDYLQ